MSVESIITENLDIWTSAIKARSASGRGSSSKLELYGIKKLRGLILDLAIRGKLVPQEPNDEPASRLLEAIESEVNKLVSEKKIKKPKPKQNIADEELPFEVPASWQWVRLSDIAQLENGDRSKNYPNKSLLVDKGIPFVNAGHLEQGRINSADMSYITQERFDLLRAGKFQLEDILFCLRGSLGKSAIVDNLKVGAIASSLVIIRLFGELNRLYLHYFFDSSLSYAQIKKYDNGTAQPNLSATDLAKFILPLPSLKEQAKIVEKLDELMALCDQLESQTEASIEAHQTLVKSLLETLTIAKDADELNESWQRISEHFDVLFTTEDSIDQLKQTILQLAVMGKVVKQDPNDEPASKLLERIAAEKEQLIKDKKIKKQKPLAPISESERPFTPPHGWAFCKLDDVAMSSGAGWSPQCLATPKKGDAWGVLKVSAVTWGKFNPTENKELPTHLEPKREYEVEAGDFLVSRANTAELVAKGVIVPDTCPRQLIMSDKIVRFKLHNEVQGQYINVVNNSLMSREYFSRVAGGTSSSMKNVSREQLRNLLVPLPPKPEQERIIAKIRVIDSICESLKARINESNKKLTLLTDSVDVQNI